MNVCKFVRKDCVFRPSAYLVRNHTGYIPFEGRLGRVLQEFDYFFMQMKSVNLKPVKKMSFTFDPFHDNVGSIRNVMHFITKPKIKKTNVKCAFKFDVVSDRREPTLKVELNEGKPILFKTQNLTRLELISEFNRLVLPLVKEEEVAKETKTAKAAGGGKKMGKGRK